ncbi:MAG: type II toxin-antitoxin system PemK/MazF family toxin [Candidatus Binataceae bacterium]
MKAPLAVRRGDLVIVAAKGIYSGKPRPALVVQADYFADIDSVALCLITTELIDAPLTRLTIEPAPENGLAHPCQVMIDKIVTVPREKIGRRIGALDSRTMTAVDRSLALFLGIA